MYIWTLAALFYLSVPAAAQNISRSTCSNGVCIATIEKTDSQMGATIALKGSPEALAPLNQDGGWEVWDCSSDVTDQTISVVCSDSSRCGHLYKGGAVGTIVKLDEKCTNSGFGVIVSESRSHNQSLPPAVARRLLKRDTRTPEVRRVTLKELSEADGRHGNVSFHIFGSTWGDETEARIHETRVVVTGGRQEYHKDVSEIIAELGPGTEGAENPFNTPAHDGSHLIRRFNKHGTIPVNVDTSINLFNQDLFCSKFSRARVGVTAKSHVLGTIGVGVIAAGDIWPPNLIKFRFFSEVNADVEARLKLGLSVEGTIASGDVSLFTLGIPGLSVPGLIHVGPAFRVIANAGATLGLDMDVDVSLKYKISNWNAAYPSSDSAEPLLIPQDTDNLLIFAVSEHVEAYAIVEGHVTARLEVSVDLFNHKARAAVFVGLDAYAKAKAGVKHQSRVVDTIKHRAEPNHRIIKSIAGRRLPGLPFPEGTHPDNQHPSEKFERRELAGLDAWADTNNSICASLVLGLNAHVGAEGSLYNIIGANFVHVLWRREWALFKKCVEDLPAYLSVPLKGENTPSTTTAKDVVSPGPTVASLSPAPELPYLPWRTDALISESGSFNPPLGDSRNHDTSSMPSSSFRFDLNDERKTELGGGVSFRREAGTMPDRIPTPIQCGGSIFPVSLTMLFNNAFAPLSVEVLPNGVN